MDVKELSYSGVNTKVVGNAVKDYLDKLSGLELDEENKGEAKERYRTKIMAKLKAGKKLTIKEKRYVKKYDPELYAVVMRIEVKREALENRLEHAKSKQEVTAICMHAVSSIDEKDPAREYIIAAVNKTIDEFKKTTEYKKLPATDEDEEKKKIGKVFEKDENKESDAIAYEYSEDSYQLAFSVNEINTHSDFTA